MHEIQNNDSKGALALQGREPVAVFNGCFRWYVKPDMADCARPYAPGTRGGKWRYYPAAALKDNKQTPGDEENKNAKKAGKDSSTAYGRFHHSTKCDGWPKRLTENEWIDLLNKFHAPLTPEDFKSEAVTREIKDPNPAKEMHLYKDLYVEHPVYVKAAKPDLSELPRYEGSILHDGIIAQWKAATRKPINYKITSPYPPFDILSHEKNTPVQLFFMETERTALLHPTLPYPHDRQGCTGKRDPKGYQRPAHITGRVRRQALSYDARTKLVKKMYDQGASSSEIRAHIKQITDFFICPECGDHPTQTRPHRTSRRIYHPDEQFIEIANPDFDRAYVYKDYHGDLICSHCGFMFEYHNQIKTRPMPENWQKPDNSDHRGIDGGENGNTSDPMYNTFYIKKLHRLEPIISNMDPDKDRNKVVDAKRYLKRSSRDKATITQLPNVTLQYCTTGESFYGRPLIRTDPKHPNKKEFYCQICRKVYAGQPYAKYKTWHYIKTKDTKQRGYNEQAVLTAIAANPGKSKSDIANYCQANFKDGRFSIGNVSDIIEYYRMRGMVYVLDGSYKNNKRVY